ncbi:hypothetical protein [Microbacterium deminutum]|uniref:Uncharacterized protein n=1 Tax=Microbacterium deminutum TaxID=344164 RepID=A0ABP5CS43_9MICO
MRKAGRTVGLDLCRRRAGIPVRPATTCVPGTEEPFFLDNVTRWALALRAAVADVALQQRTSDHGPGLWRAMPLRDHSSTQPWMMLGRAPGTLEKWLFNNST